MTSSVSLHRRLVQSVQSICFTHRKSGVRIPHLLQKNWDWVNTDMEAIPGIIAAQLNAKVAQSVEHNLAKVGVASSNLVFRSICEYSSIGRALVFQTGGCRIVPCYSLNSSTHTANDGLSKIQIRTTLLWRREVECLRHCPLV
jgi:hypothetical protein